MAHISSIGAGIFSDLSIAAPSAAPAFATLDTQAEFDALFATEIASAGGTKAANTFVRVANVREFPSIGTPANVVNVPVYGQKFSQTIGGQADAPGLEVTLNYIATDWATGSILGDLVGSGNQVVFRFSLLNSEPTLSTTAKYASTVAGLGSVQNTNYYWIGKLESLLVNPQLTDANTATLTLTIQSKFYGAYTL
jgi:hypothetical protein